MPQDTTVSIYPWTNGLRSICVCLGSRTQYHGIMSYFSRLQRVSTYQRRPMNFYLAISPYRKGKQNTPRNIRYSGVNLFIPFTPWRKIEMGKFRDEHVLRERKPNVSCVWAISEYMQRGFNFHTTWTVGNLSNSTYLFVLDMNFENRIVG